MSCQNTNTQSEAHSTNAPAVHQASKPAGLHRVKLVKNHNYVKDGKKSYGHLLRKYNIKPTLDGPFAMIDEIHSGDQQVLHRLQNRVRGKPAHVSRRRLVNKNGQDGEVSAQDIQNDSEYLAPVTIGGQTLNLDFDTGSADLNVQMEGKAAHHIFNPATSHTWKPANGEHWSITYGDGSTASGNVGTDTVTIGGLQVTSQAVEVATKLSSQFVQGAGDGLLGLAFGSINTVTPEPVKTPVENMIAQSAIPSSAELFTAYLGSVKDINDPDHGESFYTFGFIDEDVVRANGNAIYYTPVNNSYGFWQVESTAYAINGQTHPLANNTSVMDTGTTLALIDDQRCKNIYAEIHGSTFDTSVGGYVFPANTPLSELPDVEFDIGGKMCRINREDLAFAPAGNGNAFGCFQSRGDLPFDIYGDTVLKNMYAIFDAGQTRFGWVQRNDPDGQSGKHHCHS